MTVPSFFTPQQASPSVIISQSGIAPTLRGTESAQISSSSVAIPLPAGTVEGDLALVAVVHGYGPNTPAGWTSLYNSGNASGVDGGCFFKVLDAADIASGTVTVTFTNGDTGRAVIVTYENGASLNLDLIFSSRSTGSPASVPFTYAGLASNSYFIFGGHWGNGEVTFAVASSAESDFSADRSAALGLYNPASNGVVSEVVNYANSTQCLTLAVSITENGTGDLVALSTDISAAMEGTRWPVGPLYFEMEIAVLAGTPCVGLCQWDVTFGAGTLGNTVNSLGYFSNGLVRLNNSTLATLAPFVQGDRICVAYHQGTRLVWFRVNGGSWNNDGAANPATFTNGISLEAMTLNRVSPACGFSTVGSAIIAAFAESDFVHTPPSGYNSLEEVNVTVCHDISSGFAPMGEPTYVSDWAANTTEQAIDNHSPAVSFPAGPVKLIAGEVRENDVGVEGRIVRMYNRRTGGYVGEAVTNASGEFSIPAQDPNLPHYVIALDDHIEPDYNAKIYDNVIPG